MNQANNPAPGISGAPVAPSTSDDPAALVTSVAPSTSDAPATLVTPVVPTYLAIDVGGTKTLIALFNSSGDIISKQKFPTPPQPTSFPTALTQNLTRLFNSSRDIFPSNSPTPEPENPPRDINPPASTSESTPSPADYPPRDIITTAPLATSPTAIAIAVPGQVDGPVATTLPNLPLWRQVNLAEITRAALQSALHLTPVTTAAIPVAVNNDAAIATAYEARHLPGKSIYLTFSTGIGGGLAEDGSVLPESANFEPGHQLYPWRGHPTEWEKFASAKSLERDYNGQTTPDGTPTSPTPNDVPDSTSDSPTPNSTPDGPSTPAKSPTTPPLLATDLTTPAQLQDIATRLTPGLARLIREYHPAHIIIGGPLGDNFPLFQPYLLANLKETLKSPTPDNPASAKPNPSPDDPNHPTPETLPDIIKAKYPQESTIYGCYLFAHHLKS